MADADIYLRHAAVPVHARDAGGRIVFANRAALSLFGWPPCTEESAHAPAHNAAEDEALRLTMRNGYWCGDLERLDAGGNTLVIESQWSLVDVGDPERRRCFVVELDRTELRATQGQALRAQRMESIGTLAGGVAHQINNVLGPILIAAEMLRKRITDPWAENKLTAIEEAARSGADVVKQVLDFARGVEGDRMAMQIRHLLKDLVRFAESTFTRSIVIRSSLSRDVAQIVGDTALLRQMVLNLMVNARDAMPDGGELSVVVSECVVSADDVARYGVGARPGSFVRIDIADTGVGMSSEVMEHMFEPFYSTKMRAQGTGLGLSTVLTIVRSHNGFIHVDSEVGSGTTFSVFLPAQAAAETSPAGFSEGDEVGGATASDGLTVLIVDDEPWILEMNRELLESYGYRTLCATNGQEGLDILESNPSVIDAVVTDVNMPVMDGAEMIRRMRGLRRDIPVVAVSGLTEDMHLLDGKGFEQIEILGKPYTSDQLISAIRGMTRTSSDRPRIMAHDAELDDADYDRLLNRDDW